MRISRPGLDGEALLDALERVADAFEVLEPAHVALQHLAPGARSGAGERVGRIDQRRQDGLRLHFFVVCGDGVDHLRRLAVLARDVGADDGVRALDLVGQRLADVVQQRGAARLLLVEAQLGRHGAADEGGFDRVHEHVLGVAVAVLQHAEQLDQLGMHAVDADLEDRLLAGLAHALLDRFLGLAHHLLDAAGVDAAVRDQALERALGDLAPDRVEARHDHRFRRVVDDEVDAGGRLERADVAPFAADDAALQIVARQMHHRDGALGDELARQAFDGDRDDLLGLAVGLLARLLLDQADALGGLVARLVHHLLDELLARLVAGEAGGLLELVAASRRPADPAPPRARSAPVRGP